MHTAANLNLPPGALELEHLSADGQGVSIRLTAAADLASRENDGPFYASASLLCTGSALGALGEGGQVQEDYPALPDLYQPLLP